MYACLNDHYVMHACPDDKQYHDHCMIDISTCIGIAHYFVTQHTHQVSSRLAWPLAHRPCRNSCVRPSCACTHNHPICDSVGSAANARTSAPSLVQPLFVGHAPSALKRKERPTHAKVSDRMARRPHRCVRFSMPLRVQRPVGRPCNQCTRQHRW